MSCSLARAAAPPVTALSTPPRKKPRLFSPEPARAAPAQQTAIRSGEGTNVQPDRFGCWCRTAGCLIPLFTCVLNLETDQVRGGHLPKTKAARRQRPFASLLLLLESVSLPSSSSSLARRADARMRAGGADSSAAAATRLQGSRRRGTPEA